MGRAVGSGSGIGIAGAVGAVVGAVSGDAIEKNVTRMDGYEITVELEPNRDAIAIVQAADEKFAVNERVKVLRRADGAARVTKT
jgi:outer membrane lipoprotein SlyB